MTVLDTFRLDGKVALVTGGSRGLGLQIAHALGEAGAAVAITARKPDGLTQATQELEQAGITTTSVPCDISKNDEVEPPSSTSWPPSIRSTSWSTTRARPGARRSKSCPWKPGTKWSAPTSTARIFVSRAVGIHMIHRGQGGRIINIASVAGLRGSDPNVMPTLPYNTSKGAVVNFTRALAATLAEHQITVNCICPGFFPTKMSAGRPGKHRRRRDRADAAASASAATKT